MDHELKSSSFYFSFVFDAQEIYLIIFIKEYENNHLKAVIGICNGVLKDFGVHYL